MRPEEIARDIQAKMKARLSDDRFQEPGAVRDAIRGAVDEWTDEHLRRVDPEVIEAVKAQLSASLDQQAEGWKLGDWRPGAI